MCGGSQMANNIFAGQMTEALKNAKKLELAGERELSKQMCIKCVKKAASHNNFDIVALFYGDRVYDDIKNVADAAKCIFIAKCAIEAYNVIYSKSPANSAISPWAKIDKWYSDGTALAFFEWLQQSNRKVDQYDCNRFKSFMTALSKPVSFKMSDRVAQMSLFEIVRKIVSGSINIANGELR